MKTTNCIKCLPRDNRALYGNYRFCEAFSQDANVLFCSGCCQFYKQSKYQKIVWYIAVFLSFCGVYLLSLLYHGHWLLKSGFTAVILLCPSILERIVILRWMNWQSFDYKGAQSEYEPLVYHVNECQFCKGKRTLLSIGDSSLSSVIVNPSVLICDSCAHIYMHSHVQSYLHTVFFVVAVLLFSVLSPFLIAHNYHIILWLLFLVVGYSGQVLNHWILRKLPWNDLFNHSISDQSGPTGSIRGRLSQSGDGSIRAQSGDGSPIDR